jgi:ATP-dependent helicase HrpB
MAEVPAPTGLPVESCVPSLRAAMADGGVAVLHAPPGAGKSTVVPLRLRGQPWLDGRIVVLEPRRLATRATARRMAQLLGEDVGHTVGYRTRDERRTGRNGRIEVVTEGILTRRLQQDPSLPGIGMVIFDEVHERNLQSDLALAFTLDVRRSLRPDLRVLAMSATLDDARLAALLGDAHGPAPVIEVSGRAHPVDVRWRPRDRRGRLADAVVAAVVAALRADEGDLLVFLPGAAEIRWVAEGLTAPGELPPRVDVRRLFGALKGDEQDLALAPSPPGRRRVVLATDIAETSLTVDGVRIVIDAGQRRRPRYDRRSGLPRLETGAASRASAAQRTGRAGRTSPGVAYRLWAESEHSARPAFAEPEIVVGDLASLALELAVWGAPTDELAFLDAPPPDRLAEAQHLLRRLGALDDDGRPTAMGRSMLELPIHPRLAHMVQEAIAVGGGPMACAVAALLEERDVLRGRPGALSAGLGERVRLVLDPSASSPHADRAALAVVRRRALELARRVGVELAAGHAREVHDVGAVVAAAYPDRIAQARGGGRFRLRAGRGVVLAGNDPLIDAPFLVVADLGPGPRGRDDDAVRLAAAIDQRDVEQVAGADIVELSAVAWSAERNDLEARVERRLDAIVLSAVTARPAAGPTTTAALVEHVRSEGLDRLSWSAKARALQARAVFARAHLGDPWPDVSDAALADDLDGWLAPRLTRATGRADLERVDLLVVLRERLGHRLVGDLDWVAPGSVALAGRRSATVDYSTDPPSISARAQDLFGLDAHPAIAAGKVPLTVHVLSPAGRPVQVTADLPGFWKGSWAEVRREMISRYPKHDWPADPTSAAPGGRASRRR